MHPTPSYIRHQAGRRGRGQRRCRPGCLGLKSCPHAVDTLMHHPTDSQLAAACTAALATDTDRLCLTAPRVEVGHLVKSSVQHWLAGSPVIVQPSVCIACCWPEAAMLEPKAVKHGRQAGVAGPPTPPVHCTPSYIRHRQGRRGHGQRLCCHGCMVPKSCPHVANTPIKRSTDSQRAAARTAALAADSDLLNQIAS